jgi:hypothetical protein
MNTMLGPDLRRRAAATAARRCDDLAEPVRPAFGDDVSPSSPRWLDQALSKGAPGIAVLHGVRAQRGSGDPARTRAWLAESVREDISAAPGAGLWFGAPAVAFAFHTAAPGRHPAATARLDAAVARLVRLRLHAAHARIDAAQRPSLSEFDLVRGLTGLGAYLIRHCPDDGLVRDVLTYLVRLTEPLATTDSAGPAAPGWWTADPPAGLPAHRFAAGHIDLGMAHGISGPLAFMALATRRGITVPGQGDAISRISGWLTRWRHDSPTGPWWPERIGLDELHAGQSTQDGPSRPSWCYGTPGIARALQLAAIADNDRPAQQAAEHAFARCLADPAQRAELTDISLCHGWAGLVATACAAATDAITADVTKHLPTLVDTLIDHAENRSTGPPGLIHGAAGVALTLDTVATGPTASTLGWAACLQLT